MSNKRKHPDGRYVVYSDLELTFKNSDIKYFVDWNTLINNSEYFNILNDTKTQSIELNEDPILFKEMLNIIYHPLGKNVDYWFHDCVNGFLIESKLENFVLLLDKYQIDCCICNLISRFIVDRDNINLTHMIINFCFRYIGDESKYDLYKLICQNIQNKKLKITDLDRKVIEYITDNLLSNQKYEVE